jgi:hypothetical protein
MTHNTKCNQVVHHIVTELAPPFSCDGPLSFSRTRTLDIAIHRVPGLASLPQEVGALRFRNTN